MRHHAFVEGRTLASRRGLFDWMLWVPCKIIELGSLALKAVRVRHDFHYQAEIHSTCRLGVEAGVRNFGSRDQIRVGRNSIVRGLLRVGDFGPAKLEIGDDVYIGDGVIISCTNHIQIESDVLLAHNVQIFDNNSHPLSMQARAKDWRILRGFESTHERVGIESAPIKLHRGSWIGFGAVILKGAEIGEGSIVAAGSVVRGTIPPYSICAGNPAVVIGKAPQ